MSGLDPVLRDFKADVERAEHLLELVKTFKEFGASVPPTEHFENAQQWREAMSLYEASKFRRTDLPLLSGSLQLYLVGRFEYCIRQIIEVVADEVSSRATKYGDLPEALKNELKVRTLEIVQNPRRYGYDEDEADALLAALVASKNCMAPPVSIRSAVLSLTDSNMRDRILSDLLKRVGMQDFWRDVGHQAPMKLTLDKATSSEATAEAQARLNAIMDERNQVAHPTAETKFPDPDKVLKSAHFLNTLAATAVDLAKVYLAAYKPTAA